MQTSAQVSATSAALREGEFLGHPRCLFTLFFAEMWERFSFYGMKALLILYMVNYLFWRQDEASHVMALYAGFVYATPVLGGIIADKLTGARWAVVIGGVIIATGHFLLAFEPLPFFYAGLICLVIGTGFLKPNISTQVGALYRSDDERRDAAFTIFYMGINLGAFLGPIVCGALRIAYGYHYGFAAAGVGMVIGLIVYLAGMGSVVRRERLIRQQEGEIAAAGSGAAAQARAGAHPPHVYRDRAIVLVVICVFAILFWVGFEQAANVMNLWADKHTNLHIFRARAPMVELPQSEPAAPAPPAESSASGGWADWQMTAEQSQSINPLFIIIFAGVFAWLWEFLEKRGKQPSTPMKMALGVLFLTLAYAIMLAAGQVESRPTSAPLAQLPQGLHVDERGRVYRFLDQSADRREFYGATRLRWENGTLRMNGVLTDIDWMRALAATCAPEYAQAVAALARAAEERAEEVRRAKQAGTMPREATWEVSVSVPADDREIRFIAGLPQRGGKPFVTWDPAARTLRASDTLSEKDRAQLLAGGAEPAFRDALTRIYRESSTLKISILWLLAFYMVLTIGELCLSPVGLSLVTKAAHPRYVGLFMGFWFLTTGAISNYLAHTVGGYWGTMQPTSYFMIFGVIGLIATIIMLLLLRVLRPMLHGIR